MSTKIARIYINTYLGACRIVWKKVLWPCGNYIATKLAQCKVLWMKSLYHPHTFPIVLTWASPPQQRSWRAMCEVPSRSRDMLCCMKGGDHWCIKRCLWGDLQHFLISLCERIKPGPFIATDCHTGKRLLEDLCQMLLLKAQPHQ